MNTVNLSFRRLALLAALIASPLLFNCSSNSDFEKGKRQLENTGYTAISDTGFEAFCCGDDDKFATGFSAKDKSGSTVTGCFCSSIGKGITVRFN